jgi:hypothetical protein
MLRATHELFRSLLSLGLAGGLGFGLWIGYQALKPLIAVRQQLQAREAQVLQLTADLENQQRVIQQLDTALRLLKVDRRIAQIAVLDQYRRQQDGQRMTKLLFAEVDNQGQLLDAYKTFEIEGDIVYIDAWVAKFMDEHVEAGVPLRSTSLCLFRRVFGEHQRPREGFLLDAVGARPAAYRGAREMSQLEADIWAHFWEYANDPAKASQVGLRALQGEAPSIRLVQGRAYWIQLRASDGLTIKLAEQPAPALAAAIRHASQSQPSASPSPQSVIPASQPADPSGVQAASFENRPELQARPVVQIPPVTSSQDSAVRPALVLPPPTR